MGVDKDAVKGKVAEFLKIPVSKIDDSMSLKGMVRDSFMLVELLIELQEEFGIHLSQMDVEKVDTISELTDLILQRAHATDVVIDDS